ncbi:hypothetical protein D3C76_857390 [compost metagenome]
MLAVVLQQAGEDADLFGDGIRLGAGLLEQHLKLLFLRSERLRGAQGILFEAGQFGLSLVQSIADQHQLLQAIAVGIPGFAQRRQVSALLKLRSHALQVFGSPGLLLVQGLNRALALSAGLLGGLPGFGAECRILGQAGEGALFLERLTQ